MQQFEGIISHSLELHCALFVRQGAHPIVYLHCMITMMTCVHQIVYVIAAMALFFPGSTAWEWNQAANGKSLLCNFNTQSVPHECDTCVTRYVFKIDMVVLVNSPRPSTPTPSHTPTYINANRPSQKFIYAMPLTPEDTSQDSGDFFAQVFSGALNAASNHHVDISIRGLDSTTAVDCEVLKSYSELIRNATAEKPSGLVVIPIQTDTCPDTLELVPNAIRNAVAAGVPVVAINASPEEAIRDGALLYVGQDEVRAGEEACAALARSTGGDKATILFMDTINGTDPGINARLEGCKRNATVVYMSTDNASEDQDIAAVEEILKAHPEVNAILAMGGTYQVTAMIQASKRANRTVNQDIFLATTDWSPAGVTQALESGQLQFVVDQQAPLQGSIPINMLFMRASTGNFPTSQTIYTGPRLILPNETFSSPYGVSACSAFARPYCGQCNGESGSASAPGPAPAASGTAAIRAGLATAAAAMASCAAVL